MAAALAALGLLSACGGSSATPTPTPPAPSASPTPDVHLVEPASGREVYTRLNQAGMRLIGTNASEGTEPRRRINATYAGWPLVLLEYSGTTARAKALPFRDGSAPGAGQSAYTFVGLNIAILWGPIAEGQAPASPDAAKVAVARKLAAALEALVGPLGERSAEQVTASPPTPAPPATASPSPITSP